MHWVSPNPPMNNHVLPANASVPSEDIWPKLMSSTLGYVLLSPGIHWHGTLMTLWRFSITNSLWCYHKELVTVRQGLQKIMKKFAISASNAWLTSWPSSSKAARHFANTSRAICTPCKDFQNCQDWKNTLESFCKIASSKLDWQLTARRFGTVWPRFTNLLSQGVKACRSAIQLAKRLPKFRSYLRLEPKL